MTRHLLPLLTRWVPPAWTQRGGHGWGGVGIQCCTANARSALKSTAVPPVISGKTRIFICPSHDMTAAPGHRLQLVFVWLGHTGRVPERSLCRLWLCLRRGEARPDCCPSLMYPFRQRLMSCAGAPSPITARWGCSPMEGLPCLDILS